MMADTFDGAWYESMERRLERLETQLNALIESWKPVFKKKKKRKKKAKKK